MDDKTRASFDFLKHMAQEGKSFTKAELIQSSNWSKNTVEMYLSKKFSGFVRGDGSKYEVDKKFLRVLYDRYAALFKQKRNLFGDYDLIENPDVTIYEFFLPLSLEAVLRQALDELFYKDTVNDRLRLIGIEKVEEKFKRKLGQNDEEFLEDICQFVGRKFVGYSIHHVNGRFRTDELLTRDEALANNKDGASYVIDETTAVARFIIPHESQIQEGLIQPELKTDKPDWMDEKAKTEWLFRHIFVEAVLEATTDQDQIWLLESGTKHRLYRYISHDQDEG